ncbi:ABC transporter ATP-binding protein [Derxia lacustris]|uniref:ABC transporter ATP-binding protein n=1 Tax=Derxia lacustris TaxID=764842 RepID=UPI000A16EEB8|nr:ABC transporter ATP-binding protein [Derxia lacustris]
MASDNASPFLAIRGLRKTYGDAVAIEHLSLDIRRGEFMTFLGPSGSGKSTTLYIVAGFQDPTEGSVALDGRNLLAVPPNQRNIGMVFQRYTLFPHLTVAENVAFPLRVRKRPEAEIKARVQQMLALVHLADLGGRMPAQLSGGQQQRVAIARALAYDPPLLLMDEPLSALDKKLREELQDELRRIHRETGVTVLYVTHDQEEALRLSDRIAVFSKGRIEQCDSGAALYEAPASRFVASFLGNSNFLPVTVEAVAGGAAELALPNGLRAGSVPLHMPMARGASATLMLRPDRIRVLPAPARTDGPGIEVRVRDVSYLGDSLHYAVVTPWEQEISIRRPLGDNPEAAAAIGDHVRIEWDPARARVYAAA